ncbi:MAG: hypothetical protein IJY70_02680 [Clostridia bacterium]|nr:hypothetical protein [Clostridia bacterium]
MKVKKLIAGLLTLLICFCTIACEPVYLQEYTVGDTQTTLDGCDIKLVCADYETDGEIATIRLKYEFTPRESVIISESEVYLIVVPQENTYSLPSKNTSENGYDIFGAEVTQKTEYSFYFEVPHSPYFDNLDNRDKGHNGFAIKCRVLGIRFEIHTGVMFDEKTNNG